MHIPMILAIALAAAAPAVAQTVNVTAQNPVPNGTDLHNGATVNVLDGGVVGLAVDLSNGTLNVSGGSVALGATGISTGFTNTNNDVVVTGGNVGPFFQFFSGSTGLFTGGTLDTFGVFSGSSVTAAGSTITGFADVFSGGSFTIEGGDVNSFRALTGSAVEIVGTGFTLGGAPIDLDIGESVVLGGRNQTLEATLADGSVFTHPLLSANLPFPTPGVAVPSAEIRLTRVVPAPGVSAAMLFAVPLVVRRRR